MKLQIQMAVKKASRYQQAIALTGQRIDGIKKSGWMRILV